MSILSYCFNFRLFSALNYTVVTRNISWLVTDGSCRPVFNTCKRDYGICDIFTCLGSCLLCAHIEWTLFLLQTLGNHNSAHKNRNSEDALNRASTFLMYCRFEYAWFCIYFKTLACWILFSWNWTDATQINFKNNKIQILFLQQICLQRVKPKRITVI